MSPHNVSKQAVPLFLSKLLLLARYMNRKIAEWSVNPSGLFVLARDQGPVSRKSRKLFGLEKPLVKLRLVNSVKLVFSYVVTGI